MAKPRLSILSEPPDQDNPGTEIQRLLHVYEDRFASCGWELDNTAATMVEFLCAVGSLQRNAMVRPLLESAGLISSVGTYLSAIESVLSQGVRRKPIIRETKSETPRPSLARVVNFQKQMERIEAVPAIQAARYLGIDRKTVYRWVDDGKLEMIRRNGKAWISVRSIETRMNERYFGTQEFDIRDGGPK